MKKRYTQIPTPADLSVSSLLVAFGSLYEYELHVHEGLDECARRVLTYPEFDKATITIVISKELAPHEWFIRVAAGSKPT